MGRTFTKLGNCFQSSETNFENQTQQMPVLKQHLYHLGYLISEQGIQPLPDKITANTNLAEPKNIDELHHFLGLTSYYRRFKPPFADITKPSTNCSGMILNPVVNTMSISLWSSEECTLYETHPTVSWHTQAIHSVYRWKSLCLFSHSHPGSWLSWWYEAHRLYLRSFFTSSKYGLK